MRDRAADGRTGLSAGGCETGTGRVPVDAPLDSNATPLVPEPYSHPRFNPEPDRASGFRTRNILAAPMVDIDRKPIGVLQVINKKGGGFEPVDGAMIQMLADQAGVAIQ